MDRTWQDTPSLDDHWGRAVWALGSVVARRPDLAEATLAHFTVAARRRSQFPRAMAFAALGAAEVLHASPGNPEARSLLGSAAALIGPPTRRTDWRWPEPRLSYANAVLAEALLVAGTQPGQGRILADGLAMLRWLVDIETNDGRLSVTPVDGWAIGEPRPGFDQQPIEVATLADAAARALDLTGDQRWKDTVLLCEAWFRGANDRGTPMLDPRSGGCCDGLEPTGRNENQGAESTLAMISTLQQAHRLGSAGRDRPAMTDLVRRSSTVLYPDSHRVVARPFVPGPALSGPRISRAEAVLDRVLDLTDAEVAAVGAAVRTRFRARHRDLDAIFEEHAALVAHLFPRSATPGAERRQLIGAYFTQEYAVEAAALFNPSMVAHPDQSGLAAGELRFVMSMRALGEGHISSIEFRSGVLAHGDSIRFDEQSPFARTGRVRRETVRSLSAARAGDLRGAVPSTRGPGRTNLWCASCSARSTAG